MHQWIKAVLHQDMKQMMPSPLKDKDVSGKAWLEVGQGLSVSARNPDNGSINSVVTKGAPPPSEIERQGTQSFSDGGRVLRHPIQKEVSAAISVETASRHMSEGGSEPAAWSPR